MVLPDFTVSPNTIFLVVFSELIIGGHHLANHKSAAKRARKTLRKTTINSRTKMTVRTFEKKLRAAISKKDGKEAQELLISYTSKIAKAAQKGVIKSKAASRKIARLSKSVHQLVSS